MLCFVQHIYVLHLINIRCVLHSISIEETDSKILILISDI